MFISVYILIPTYMLNLLLEFLPIRKYRQFANTLMLQSNNCPCLVSTHNRKHFYHVKIVFYVKTELFN